MACLVAEKNGGEEKGVIEFYDILLSLDLF
jgi:hypothetical protein